MTAISIADDLHGFNGKRILIVGAGALAVTQLPELVLQFRQKYRETTVRLVLTRQALQFVTPTAVNMVAGRKFFLDTWHDGPYDEAPHVEMAQWMDAVAIYPATLNFVARLALGMADTPLMLALQCTDVPIALAPSLPLGGFEGFAYRKHVAALGERPNVVVAPPVMGRSMSTGELNTGAPLPFPTLLELLHRELLHGELRRGAQLDTSA